MSIYTIEIEFSPKYRNLPFDLHGAAAVANFPRPLYVFSRDNLCP
jgi:hypothetical protein